MSLEASTFRQAVIENTLRSCQLFMGLPAADIAAMASFVVSKHLDKGDYLFREGDRSEGFYLVQKGAINVHRVSTAGKEQVIHVFRPIESFAEATLATEGGYPADARATEPTTVLLVPKNEFVDLLRRRPDLALRMLGSMSQHLRVIVGLLDDLTLKDMETRLANWLLKHCPRPISKSRGRNQTRPDQTRASGGVGSNQRNLFANSGKISRPETSAHERQHAYRNASRPIAETASTAPGRTLITAVACDVDSLAFFGPRLLEPVLCW